jgi:hypothetical protein
MHWICRTFCGEFLFTYVYVGFVNVFGVHCSFIKWNIGLVEQVLIIYIDLHM